MDNHKYISPADAPAWHSIIEMIRTAKLLENGAFARWTDMLSERDQKEVKLALLYADQFAHGTTGHMQLMLINNLCRIVDFILDNYQLTPKD